MRRLGRAYGATHQAVEDLATMRIIPRMVMIAPCDYDEAKKATLAMAKYVGPAYMRLAREASPRITTSGTPFAIGKAEVFYTKSPEHTKSVGIISTGIMTYQALVAAKTLNERGIGASVLHAATSKPLDTAAVERFAETHDGAAVP